MRTWLAILSLVCAGCGLEQELFGAMLDRGHIPLPEPNPTIVHGKSSVLEGGSVSFYLGGGPSYQTNLDADGAFETPFPGTLERQGLVVWGQAGERVAIGLLASLPKQPTIFHEPRHITLWDAHDSTADLGPVSTTVALVVMRAAEQQGIALAALTPGAIETAMDAVLADLLVEDSPVRKLGDWVAALTEKASLEGDVPVFIDAIASEGGAAANPEWFTSLSDIQVTADSFEAALDEAAGTIQIDVCYPKDTIRVVFQVAFDTGTPNANCVVVDPYKWTENLPGKQVFLTGGVHEDTPVCDDSTTTACLTEGQIDAINAQMGQWVPNQVALNDSGEDGDALAGDGIWTRVFEIPYIQAVAEGKPGVRLAYKYTYGLPGQGWTDSEEWPGNQRLLELADLNGDYVIVRRDIFGDETANKDKVNGLKPGLGGCGFMNWDAERDPSCVGDTRENRIDADGDCTFESWPEPGPVAPLTVPCQ